MRQGPYERYILRRMREPDSIRLLESARRLHEQTLAQRAMSRLVGGPTSGAAPAASQVVGPRRPAPPAHSALSRRDGRPTVRGLYSIFISGTARGWAQAVGSVGGVCLPTGA